MGEGLGGSMGEGVGLSEMMRSVVFIQFPMLLSNAAALQHVLRCPDTLPKRFGIHERSRG